MSYTRGLLTAAGWSAASAGALAAAAEGKSSNPMAFEVAPFVMALLTFGVTALILGRVAWPKVLKGLQDRENKIRAEIEGAESARRQASDALKQYERSLAEARAEASAMLDKTRQEQQKLAAELKLKADAELAAMREKAQRDIEAAKREAVYEIYNTASALSLEIAGKILRREINADDHRRLVEESLGELEGARR